MNNIDAKITAWQLGPVTIMRGTATPGRDVTHPECFGRFTVVALSYGGAIRKGVPPEETARSLRIPIDEVKAIILQAHPAPAPEKPAGIGDNRRES